MTRKVFCAAIGLVIIFGVFGCATIIHQEKQDIDINSNPSAASVKIYDLDTEKLIQEGTTPMTVTLERGRSYGKKGRYKVVVEKEGHDSREVLIEGMPDAWYIIGNFFIGGLIGWVIVDPATGAMWMLDPKEVDVDFTKPPEKEGEEGEGEETSMHSSGEGLRIVFWKESEIPQQVRDAMVPVSPGF